MGRQHQGMNRPGVRQVPEGSGEQGNMEKTGCKIICGVPTTLAVKGLIMMMMMKNMGKSYHLLDTLTQWSAKKKSTAVLLNFLASCSKDCFCLFCFVFQVGWGEGERERVMILN